MEKNFDAKENNNVQSDMQSNEAMPSLSTQYQQVTYNVPVNVSVGEWMITKLILCVPFVGLIMLFVWAFGGGTSISKQNWAKAELIWILIFPESVKPYAFKSP